MSTLGKHKTRSSLKKRFIIRSKSKIIFKEGNTSHRMSRKRPGTVAERSKRKILNNSNIINLLHKAGYACASNIRGK